MPMSHFPTGSRGIRPTGRKVGAVFRRSKCSSGFGGWMIDDGVGLLLETTTYCRYPATKTCWGYVVGNSPFSREKKLDKHLWHGGVLIAHMTGRWIESLVAS